MKKIIFIAIVLFMLILIYLFSFSYIDKQTRVGNRTYSVLPNSLCKLDTLSYYYLEFEAVPEIDELLLSTQDSIFMRNYLVSHPNSVTLKNPKQTMIHFTNNYTSSTLYSFSYFLKTNDETYLEIFKKNAKWMKENGKIIDDTIMVFTNDNMIYDKYNLDYGWASSYGQGFGLSVFSRMYSITQDSTWLKMCEMLTNSFNFNREDGGIVEIDKNQDYWYLEYPADPPGKVLNGFIFGLFGLYDYYRISKSSKALTYFNRGIKTLTKNLDKYDLGYWSKYDLLHNFAASYGYHKSVHIPQLMALYNITDNNEFKKYSSKFERYLSEPYKSMFKLKFFSDSLRRRVSYKNPFKKYYKARFNENKK